MTCPTASALRFRWYSVCKQYEYPSPEALSAIQAERRTAEYQSALAELREHVRECERCKQDNA